MMVFPVLGAFSGLRLTGIGRTVETEIGVLSPGALIHRPAVSDRAERF